MFLWGYSGSEILLACLYFIRYHVSIFSTCPGGGGNVTKTVMLAMKAMHNGYSYCYKFRHVLSIFLLPLRTSSTNPRAMLGVRLSLLVLGSTPVHISGWRKLRSSRITRDSFFFGHSCQCIHWPVDMLLIVWQTGQALISFLIWGQYRAELLASYSSRKSIETFAGLLSSREQFL